VSAQRPPRIARALLSRAVPEDVRDGVLGDLEERFQREREAGGRRGAAWRYRRAACSFAVRFTAERARDSVRALFQLRFSLLDFRLALRMLGRYPGLTIIGGLAMSFAIALGAAVFAFITVLLAPDIPLPDVGRVVTVRLIDEASNAPDSRAAFDYFRWKADAHSIVDLSASRTLTRNIATDDGRIEPVAIAEVTSGVFGVIGMAPVMGRGLVASDESATAPAVIVISHSLWQSRFAGDSNVIGRRVDVGEISATVVGVMPAGMKFPATQDGWVPLRWSAAGMLPRQGPDIRVWGRLAPGIELAQAKAEFAALGARAAADQPATHAHVKVAVLRLADAAVPSAPEEKILLASANVFVALLLVLVSSNVALLMFARAATRESEIIVRTALGAGRGRIIMQFLSEALVLGGGAAALGLLIASKGLKWAMAMFETAANDGSPLPFWIVPKLPPIAIAYAIALTLLAACIAGVLPALKITRGLHGRLRESSAGGGSLKFGGVWTFVIVAQVALTVTFPVTAFFSKRDGQQIAAVDIGTPPSRILYAGLAADRDEPQGPFDASVTRITEKIAALPGVQSAAIATWLPLMEHAHVTVQVEGGAATPINATAGGYRVSQASVGLSFFQTFDAQALSGRLFSEADYIQPQRPVVVNSAFVERVLGGQNPIGRRVRFREAGVIGDANVESEPWREIVGVVRDLGMGVEPDAGVSGLYTPLQFGARRGYAVAARVAGDPMVLAPAVRQLARDVDPNLRIGRLQPLSDVTESEVQSSVFWFRMTIGVSIAALTLSLTGIYAVMSFTVSKRTREIGIRVALGSDSATVVGVILQRPLTQVAAGVALGGLFTWALTRTIFDTPLTITEYALVIGYVVVMFGVCLLACVMPARRALKIDPIAALRSE
jgi:predicted permease